jgi:hypothetical protein
VQSGYDRTTTTIEREWLAEIIAGTKKIEYLWNKGGVDGRTREARIKAGRSRRTAIRK